MSNRLQVTSEIYDETDFKCSRLTDQNYISKFSFVYPNDANQHSQMNTDEDGDLIVERKKPGTIEIEHQRSTELSLVGLQVWRGALLLADYVFHCRNQFANQIIVELGSGVGLTGIAAGIFVKDVVCTDIDIGGILNVIQNNINRNLKLICGKVRVMELDFKNLNWSSELQDTINQAQIILAADVIYDDDLSDALLATLEEILKPTEQNQPKTIFIALEKRYVFTLVDLDSAAPCFEYFLKKLSQIKLDKRWKMEYIPIDFPQYFNYERVKELILIKLSQ